MTSKKKFCPEQEQTVTDRNVEQIPETEPEKESETGASEEIKTETAEPQPEASDIETPMDAEFEEIKEEPGNVTLTAEEFRLAQEHIAELQKEKDEATRLLQVTKADFDNFRRRSASVRTDSLEEGKRETIKELLPLLDNFERAMESECTDENWRKGIELVHRQFVDGLKKLGLSEIETDGKFDPNLHNAVMKEAVEGRETGDILMVFQKGYRVGDKIIRYSMVKVAE